MAFTNTVEIVGDEALTNSIIDRSITELHDNISTSIGQYALRGCAALTNVNFPSVTSTGMASMYQCTALEKADFASTVAFGNNTFYGCSALKALILRNADAVSTLTGNLSGTPIASGTGYIYVPAALVDTYKAASGWSTYAAQIRAIEDYPEVCDPYSWVAVFKSIDNGSYASAYKVGDCVELDLGSEGMVNMEIVGIDVDTLADGSGTAPISWISKKCLATMHRMNPALVTNDDGSYQEGTGTIGGWEKSEMRTYLNDTIKPLIPEDVRNRLLIVSKEHNARNTEGTIFVQTTEDAVWIPGTNEANKYSLSMPKKLVTDDEYAGRQIWRRDAGTTTQFYRSYNTLSEGYYTKSDSSLAVALGFCT